VVTESLTLVRTEKWWAVPGCSRRVFNAGNLFLTLLNEEGANLTRAVEEDGSCRWTTLEIEARRTLRPARFAAGEIPNRWWEKCGLKRPTMGEAAIYLGGGNIAGHDVLRDGFEVKPGQEISDAVDCGRQWPGRNQSEGTR